MNNQIIKTYIEERSWGKFERFTQNEESTIKIITVKAGEKLSLQYHKFRNEFWRILSGEGKVIIGEEVITAKKGDEFYIPVGTKHRAEGINDELVFLEIAFGHSDENDIIRLEDKYGRQN